MKKLASILFCGAAIIAIEPASAQTALPPVDQPTKADADTGVPDIVVTAQRRSENLTSVPASVSATSGEALVATGIKDIASLTLTTPGMAVSNGVGYTQLYIRGIGNGIYVGADPSVATFVDDVPRIYGSLINNFFNVERVEVLKGAQGGLYGRNATGGAVNIITKQPSDKLEADGRVSYGERNALNAAAYVNVPLGDNVAINASVTRETHDPYVRNLASASPYQSSQFSFAGAVPITAAQQRQAANFFNSGANPDKGTNNQNFWAADSKLRFTPSNDLKITLEGDYARKHDSNGNGWYNTLPNVAQTLVQYTLIPYLGGPALGFAPGQLQVSYPTGLQTKAGNFTNYSADVSRSYIVDYGVSGKIEYSLPGINLTSISSYRWNRTYYQEDQAATSVPIIVPLVINKKHNFYQELRAVSSGTGPFHFLAGATYLRDHFDGFTQLIYLNVLPQPANVNNDNRTGYSVYGQLGYDITDRLNLTGSLRYVHEKNTADFFAPLAASASIVGKKLLPSATLSYKTDGGTLYARYAKGFKTGGVNPVVAPSLFGDSPGSVFGPEQVDSFEVGYRAQLFDHKVIFTSAVFYNKYKGLQVQDTGIPSRPDLIEAIINAGSARTYGAEASFDWRLVRPLTLSANVGYLNAKYQNFALTAADASQLEPFNYDGQQMPLAPRFQASASLNLDQPLDQRYSLIGTALYTYSSSVILKSDAGLGAPTQPRYSLVNMRLGIKTADERYSASVFVTNLFNKEYYTFGATSGSLGNFITYGDPRVIGGEIGFKFR